jgi:hypothetical protein
VRDHRSEGQPRAEQRRNEAGHCGIDTVDSPCERRHRMDEEERGDRKGNCEPHRPAQSACGRFDRGAKTVAKGVPFLRRQRHCRAVVNAEMRDARIVNAAALTKPRHCELLKKKQIHCHPSLPEEWGGPA